MFAILLLVFAGILLLTIVYVINVAPRERNASNHRENHPGSPFITLDSSHSSSADHRGGDIGHHTGGWVDGGAVSSDGGWGDSGSGGDGGGGDGGGSG